MSPGGLVREHVLKMISLLEKLKGLGDELNPHLQIDLILQSLLDSYGNFISNFYMNKIECTPAELMNMLITAQSNMKSGTVIAITSSSKTRKGKGKKKATQVQQGAKTISKKKSKSVAKGKCFHCGKDGHWKRNYKDYLSSLKKEAEGYVFTCNGGVCSWKSSKQYTTADSTIEAEYIAASDAAKEAVWIKKFVTELGVIPAIESVVPLFCDNNGAIVQAKEPRSHQKFKHIERRFHLIREIVGRGDVNV
ncbi:uncharacterized protein LOC127804548 [Diospyros lotus]|uniref:uncharacterized protein LOC127804548 n=1 Tax=Diospyros lotus TaxID=55363 RepID=UPI00225B0348|nr:uncharacterized protein LOC127804548 [Diospyros lotus]